MCIKEFLAYQCGHRSITVVRPCPMTTTGHNFPVCSECPVRAFYAETMCAGCERQLHSRWVLIREWEHRWLHERGACGCDVIFPGLLHHPRVIGDTSSADDDDTKDATKSDTKELMLTITDAPKEVESSTALVLVEAKDSSIVDKGKAKDTSEHDDKSSSKPKIPALYKEEVTDKGERRVAVRLPGLFAVEWQADHRALHETGKCTCAAGAGPYNPDITIDDMTPAERDNLRRWHEFEEAASKAHKEAADSNHDITEKIDKTKAHIKEITKEFGKFTVDDSASCSNTSHSQGGSLRKALTSDNKSQTSSRKSGQSSSGESHITRESYIAEHGTTPHQRRIAKLRLLQQIYQDQQQRAGPSTRQHITSSVPGQYQRGKGPVPHLVLESQPEAPYHPYTFNPFQTAATLPETATAMPPHLQPHYFAPAYPAFATDDTFTDTIPHGAFPWTSSIINDPSNPKLARGRGPYVNTGFTYPNQAGLGFLGPSVTTPFHVFDIAAMAEAGGNAGNNNNNKLHPSTIHVHTGYHAVGSAQVAIPAPPPPHPGAAVHLPAASGGGGSKPTSGLVKQSTPGTSTGGGRATTVNDGNNGEKTICGLPIGAGAEGVLHMPDWKECKLRDRRRTASESAVTMLSEEEEYYEEYEVEDVGEEEEEQQKKEDVEKWIEGEQDDEETEEERVGRGGQRRPGMRRSLSVGP
jgi:hypothetical protein